MGTLSIHLCVHVRNPAVRPNHPPNSVLHGQKLHVPLKGGCNVLKQRSGLHPVTSSDPVPDDNVCRKGCVKPQPKQKVLQSDNMGVESIDTRTVTIHVGVPCLLHNGRYA